MIVRILVEVVWLKNKNTFDFKRKKAILLCKYDFYTFKEKLCLFDQNFLVLYSFGINLLP
jgi:hypothetical protein